MHGPQTSLNFLKQIASLLCLVLSKKYRNIAVNLQKKKSALVSAKHHQSHRLLPRLGFEGSAAVENFSFVRVIYKII